MKKFLSIVLLLRAFCTIAAPDTTRVLFIGNSFTYTYDVPTLVKGLADAAGFPMTFVMHAPGGISVGDVDQGTEAHMYNPEVFSLIRAGNWDFVSLQDNQGRFVYGHKHFPDTAVSKVIAGHFKIRDSVRAYNSCAQMLWFAGWAFKDGYPGISPTAQGLIDNIYENYQYLKDTAGGIIAPIGKAWERAIDTLPATDLWGPDGAHESLAGAYVTASVIFTSIFRVNTEAVNFNGGLDSATARTLRRLAYHTVIDSMATTNLATFMPTLNATATLLTATPGYSGYTWYRNGVSIGSGTANTFAISTGGCYQVVGTTPEACEMRSMQQCIDSSSPTGIATMNGEPEIMLYPIPAKDVLEIDIAGNVSLPITATITDATGRVVKRFMLSNLHNAVHVGDMAGGLYVVTLSMGKDMWRGKVMVE